MKKFRYVLLTAITASVILGSSFAMGVLRADGGREFKTELNGFQEVPAISTTGSGTFEARLNRDRTALEFSLTYSGLVADAIAAHIHLGQSGVNGGVSVFLCGGGGRPACPLRSGTVTGTATAADVIGPATQGMAAGEFNELVTALRAGVTYANVHSMTFPGGEIRGQIEVEEE